MARFEVALTRELVEKLHASHPSPISRFNMGVLKCAPNDRIALESIAGRNLEDYLLKAWDMLSEEDKLGMARQLKDVALGQLRKQGGLQVRGPLETIIARTTDQALESMTPVILEEVQKRINERWEATVDRLVHDMLERAVAKIKAEMFK